MGGPDGMTGTVAALVPRDVVRTTGADAATFLQGQISQDVDAVEPGDSAWSLVLAPQGKVDAWFRLTRNEDGSFLLDIDAGFGPALVARLERFRLRVDVDFESLAGWRMLSVRGGPAAETGLEAPRAGERTRSMRAGPWPERPVSEANKSGSGPAATRRSPAYPRMLSAEVDAAVRARVEWPGYCGMDLLGPAVAPPAGLPVVTAADLDVARIRAGWPAMGRELTERTIPAEIAGLVESSVSFTKGCYTGQELVARIDSRGGNVPRPVRLLEIRGEGVSPGAGITVDGKAVGEVTSSAADPASGVTVALGPVHRRVEPPADAEVDGIPATVLATPASQSA